jgi:hypothetical protein
MTQTYKNLGNIKSIHVINQAIRNGKRIFVRNIKLSV